MQAEISQSGVPVSNGIQSVPGGPAQCTSWQQLEPEEMNWLLIQMCWFH